MDPIFGFSFGAWRKLLGENNHAVDRPYWGRAARVTLVSLMNSLGRRREQGRFGAQLEQTQIQPPIIILGHWRSGTTLLHTLLTQDAQFAYPSLFDVSNPHTFLVREEMIRKRMAGAASQQRAMDNIRVTFADPGEDESALAALCLRSPNLGWSFPRREAFYQRYLTFEGVGAQEQAEWEAAMLKFMRKLSFRYQRPIVLKSPTHTGRIRLLLKLFPTARFVHIRRNPFTVFRSTQGLYATLPGALLQEPGNLDWNEVILQRYERMYAAFFAERHLIPAERFHEISFEALEQDQLHEVGKLYEALRLPGFDEAEPKLRDYVAANASYQKNRHSDLPDLLRQQIAQRWQQSFATWGYPV